MNNISKFLNENQIRALEKIGDIIVPESEYFPSFSKVGCIEHIDSILEFTPEAELNDLKLLLNVLDKMPIKVVESILNLTYNADFFPQIIASNLRLISIALRGIIFTLYYSGKVGKNYQGINPLEIIGFQINRN
ncbi:MAG: hypothetical protein KatS3mg068_1190 [Candidatus Sericytochromatia bacterium]|nr:MAG: hypothetical protein KatS3mg068_1190 [Candidatus Sericytochromatia bacterium]